MSNQNLQQSVQELLSRESSFARFASNFSEQAQEALLLSNEEAGLLNHNYIGTEHLLLGLLRQETGIAAQVLGELGIRLEIVRKAVEHIIGRGAPLPSDAVRGLTPRAQVVIALAISEGWRTRDHLIDTEHMLLGLIREGEGIAAGVIVSLGATLDQVRMKVLQAIANRNKSETGLEPLRDAVSKSNVVTCRIYPQDMDAIDALVEVGIRSTRSDAASWLIHTGIEANQAVLESVYATVAEIRQLRSKAQSQLKQLLKTDTPSATPAPEGSSRPGDDKSV
ncbi:MAG TPA: Clp protease N-terminal domain-containing protein [Ktedonobacteraceae bacterium]|nr:Clp protease N-terminal domain-containing protein [Ktedonobacteraceae bacterium]